MIIDKKNIKNILVIRFKGLGDILLSIPALRALKTAYPGAKLSLLVNREAEQVVSGLPFIDELILFDKDKKGGVLDGIKMINMIRKSKFDLVLDLIGTPRSALITAFSGAKYRAGTTHRVRQRAYNIKVRGPKEILYGAKVHLLAAFVCGADITNETLELEIKIPKETELIISAYLNKNGIRSREVIGLNPFTKFETRNWGIENFASLSDKLVRSGKKVMLLWGPGEDVEKFLSIAKEKVLLAPETDIKSLAALLSKIRVVITTNTFTKHLAAAVKTPTLTIYGATNPRAWEPESKNGSDYIWAGVDCQPCEKNKCKDLKCLKNITVAEVLNKLTKMIE